MNSSVVHTVKEVFGDFKGRRRGIIKALTTDVRKFYQLCDPEKDVLCLYAQPDGGWEVSVPSDEVPPELPEPTIGINFSRDGMVEKDWVSLIAIHSDAWLHAVATYFGGSFGFDKADRKRLFNLMNDLPSVFEIVTAAATEKQSKEKSSVSNKGSKSNSKRGRSEPPPEVEEEEEEEDEDGEEDEEDNEDEEGETECGECGKKYTDEEFWIRCNLCKTWFHGSCVKITEAKAKRMNQFKCQSCSTRNKRVRY